MRRLARFLCWTVVAVCLAVVACGWLARPGDPDSFFATESLPHAAPGALLRVEPFTRDVPSAARAWRILYATTRSDGKPAFGSAIVMASSSAAPTPRPVIAWTHGTTGVVPGCGPSQLAHPFRNVPALDGLLREGWVFVGTDYAGQGTPGPNPYLVGAGEAHSTLDALRAARHIEGLDMQRRAVVWGHSQGGHAALWTGILAAEYAPDVELLGIAAIAPATRLRPLLESAHASVVGRIMSAYILQAYSENYADVSFDAYARGVRGWLARDMAGRCLDGGMGLFAVMEAVAAGGSIFSSPPLEGALGARLRENTPDRSIPLPVLIAQGSKDELVLPAVQEDFVRERCTEGQVIELRRFVQLDHLGIVAPGSPVESLLMEWTRLRFEGAPAATRCSTGSH